MVEMDDAAQPRGTDQVTLLIEGKPDTDREELAQVTAQLRRQLLELDVEKVELARGGQIPPGSKVADPITIGALVVTLGPAAIQAVMGLVQSWLAQGSHRDRPVNSIKITLGEDSLELSNASPEQLQQFTRAFLARHPTT
jgi:hypothetical protein